ncbi:ABC transporter permease [Syntrophothermus lipocalidus]|uniref:Inner-membrane translocator n=1 Tax=Syntrophothermus lipocalidus (strain DSM 12680 / TGB-C1) TaxID=643648 RepID=D7CML1_SYNLT|nr:ABC transporter permease [Syntrophothermus lipocalidus]ADI01946.1 inner-membrane translocator [Syntrophothermus lipocalidus DSM 12680]
MTFIAFQGSVELGIIYAIMALGVFISFRTLNMPDLTVDGSFTLGAAVSAVMCLQGSPWMGLPLAFVAGCLAGSVTALLHTKFKIQPLLSGILVMLALYSVNLRVMGRANIPLINLKTVFHSWPWLGGWMNEYATLLVPSALLGLILILLFLFLKTRFGFVLRATGDNPQMVRFVGVNTDVTILAGLALSNGLVALSGCLIAQYQLFADISMGVGMVIIGLASVIIGEGVFGTNPLLRRLLAVVLGAIVYRLVIAIAMELGMPPTDLKLVSAVVVTLALAAPAVKEQLAATRRRVQAQASKNGGENKRDA